MKNGPLAAFLAALLLCAEATAESRVRIDETNFPDAAFRAYVETLDQDGDGFLTQNERNAVTYIDVSGSAIEDLTGLAYFPALEVLDCSHNALTALDMAKHPKLSALYCYHNALTSLNVSGNPALTLLDCDDNSLTALDTTHNPELMVLECHGNKLMSLDVTRNPGLTNYSFSPQTPEALVPQCAEERWQAELSALIDGWANVSGVSVSGAAWEDGLVVWDDARVQPTVAYQYETGMEPMKVTLTLLSGCE